MAERAAAAVALLLLLLVIVGQAGPPAGRELGLDPGLVDGVGWSPWPQAATESSLPFLEAPFLNANLIKAVQSADKDAVRKLVEARASVQCRDKNNETPLMLAARSGAEDSGVLGELLHQGAPLEDTKDGQTALHLAAAAARTRSVAALIRMRANVLATDTWKSTPLMMVASSKGVPSAVLDVAQQLLAAGPAAVNMANLMGLTALRIAVQSNVLPVAKLLLGAGAPPYQPQDVTSEAAIFVNERWKTRQAELEDWPDLADLVDLPLLTKDLADLTKALRALDDDSEDRGALAVAVADLQRAHDSFDLEAADREDAYARLLAQTTVLVSLAKGWTRCPTWSPVFVDEATKPNVEISGSCDCSFGWDCDCKVECLPGFTATSFPTPQSHIGFQSCDKKGADYVWNDRMVPKCTTMFCNPESLYLVPLHATINKEKCGQCAARKLDPDGLTCKDCKVTCANGYETTKTDMACTLLFPAVGSLCPTRTQEAECVGSLDARDGHGRCCWVKGAAGGCMLEKAVPEGVEATCTSLAKQPRFDLTPEFCAVGDVNFVAMNTQLQQALASDLDVSEALRGGAEPNAVVSSTSGLLAPALFVATARQNLEAARTLVKAGANLEAKGPGGATALLGAVMEASEPLTKLLLQCGADVRATADVDKKTPLMIAAFLHPDGPSSKGQQALALVELLLQYYDEAAINMVDAKGRTALHLAASRVDALGQQMITGMCKRGARKDLKDDDGKTAEDLAGCQADGMRDLGNLREPWSTFCGVVFKSCRSGP